MTESIPSRTQELPTSSIEGFAKFIVNDRGGNFTESHLESVFAMQINKMIKSGNLPSGDKLSEQDKDIYRGKVYRASEIVRDNLGIADGGDWGASFDTVEQAEEFIEEVSDIFNRSFKSSLEEVTNG